MVWQHPNTPILHYSASLWDASGLYQGRDSIAPCRLSAQVATVQENVPHQGASTVTVSPACKAPTPSGVPV